MMIVAILAGCGGPQQQPQPQTDPDPDPENRQPATGNRQPAIPNPDPEPDPRAPDPDPDPGAGSVADQYVAAHNQYRKEHCAPPLAWSAEVAKAAQAWADHLRKADCAFEHSRTRYGENLAGGTSGALDPAGSTEMWYREVEKYDFKKGAFSMETGHFTQVVWAGTKRVGCGVTTCKGLDIIVCNYDPPGNVEGGYRQNVKPKGCK